MPARDADARDGSVADQMCIRDSIVAAVHMADAGVGERLATVEVGVCAVGGQKLVRQRGFVDALLHGFVPLFLNAVIDFFHFSFGNIDIDAAEHLGDLLEACLLYTSRCV